MGSVSLLGMGLFRAKQNVVLIVVAGTPWVVLCVRDVNLPTEHIEINIKQLWLQSAASGTFHFAKLHWAQ